MNKSSIKKIQTGLGISETGIWDQPTIAAYKNFQLRMGLPPTGVVDKESLEAWVSRTGILLDNEDTDIDNESMDIEDLDATSDLSESNITLMPMPNSQYCNSPAKYEYIFIHHTSGWNNPSAVVTDWIQDQRGQIGTQFVIGGTSIKGDSQYDGKIIQAFPEPYWAYHLGSTSKDGISAYMHKNSIGIELCNFGWLTEKNNHFYTYTGQEVSKDQVTKLDTPFRGYTYWHSYSQKQLNSLAYLLTFLSNKYSISLKNGLQKWIFNSQDPFGYKLDATAGKVKGLLSHTNVRKDKTDVYPHPELIELIKAL